jgi:hypothetical protein
MRAWRPFVLADRSSRQFTRCRRCRQPRRCRPADPWITPIDAYSLQSLWALVVEPRRFRLWPGILFRTAGSLAVALGVMVVGWRKWAQWLS